MDESGISGVNFTEDDVLEALSHLKTGKSDGDGIFAEHFIYATSALLSPFAHLFIMASCLSVSGTMFLFLCLRKARMLPTVRATVPLPWLQP